MTVSTFTHYTCDRCGDEADFEESEPTMEWVELRNVSSGECISTTLCPACRTAFGDWMKSV
jgi:hypothetical protein